MATPPPFPSPASSTAFAGASPLFLTEPELRRGIELLHFGHAHLYRTLDAVLAPAGLGRAHQRALYFVARVPGISVGELLRLLAITKQSLGRVLGDLTTRGLIKTEIASEDRRRRLLRLTDAGVALEADLYRRLAAALGQAYAGAGQQAVGGFWAVLAGLVPPAERARLPAFRR